MGVVLRSGMHSPSFSLDYYGPSRSTPKRPPSSLFMPTFWRSALAVVGVLMAAAHCGLIWLSKMLWGLGPGVLSSSAWHDVAFEYAWVGMLIGSVCAILRLPRWVYASCAAFAIPVLGSVVYAATRDVGLALGYTACAIPAFAGFLGLFFTGAVRRDYRYSHVRRRSSPLPGLAFICSILASPVGVFWIALSVFFHDSPSKSPIEAVALACLVVLPVATFAFSAAVWCHLDRNADRLQGRTLATAAWVISSLSLVVAGLVGVNIAV